MPLSALFLFAMGAGGFLVYTAVKGEHPWSLAKATIGAGAAAGQSSKGATAIATAAGPAGTVQVNPNTGTARVAGLPAVAK